MSSITIKNNDTQEEFEVLLADTTPADIGAEPKLTEATADTDPQDADVVYGGKSPAFGTIKTTWTVIKAFLKSYFDTRYEATITRSNDEPLNPQPGDLWIDLDDNPPGGTNTTIKADGAALTGDVTIQGTGLVSATQAGQVITIETTADANVQADWNQTVNTEDDYIKNKPSIPSIAGLAALDTAQTYTKGQRGEVTALSVAVNAIAIDLADSNNFSVTLQATTSQTLSEPSNPVAGQSGAITITQNNTPSTLAYHTFWDFTGTTPAVDATANSVSILYYYVYSATKAHCNLVKVA